MPTNYAEAMATAFEDEMQKIAAKKIAMSSNTMKHVGLVGAGALGALALHRAEQDRRMGRAMRNQQGY